MDDLRKREWQWCLSSAFAKAERAKHVTWGVGAVFFLLAFITLLVFDVPKDDSRVEEWAQNTLSIMGAADFVFGLLWFAFFREARSAESTLLHDMERARSEGFSVRRGQAGVDVFRLAN